MIRNLKKKTKIFQLKQKVKNKFFSCNPKFIFALFTLISPNLQVILKKFTYLDRPQRIEPILKI